MFNERSGIVNIGIDGMMIFGTWFGAWGALQWGPVAGLLTAVAAGVAVAAIHAMATITFRVDHIVSGVAINILAIGIPRFLSIVAYGQGTQSPQVAAAPQDRPPRPGRDVDRGPGDHPARGRRPGSCSTGPSSACASARPARTPGPPRASASGSRACAGPACSSPAAFAGLAGGYLSIELVGLYREGMNQGRGFIALAALILGNWSPIGAAFACLLFAWTEALTVFLRVDWINNAFIQSLPYIATLVVLALFSRRVRPPKAVGQAYEAGSPV